MKNEVFLSEENTPLVKVEKFSKKYRLRRQNNRWWKKESAEYFHALRNVSFDIFRGETVGIVGESGCGKTTLGRALVGLADLIDGQIYFDGKNIYALSSSELRLLRRRIQMIFQNPYAALNRHMRVRDIVAEGVRINFDGTREQVDERVRLLLDQVNFHKDKLMQFPGSLSGGERRRIGIARILAVQPEFIVADEPVAALDLSIKSQIVNLLQDLKEKLGLTIVFISHDMSMITYLSDKIIVMYLGKIVEIMSSKVVDKKNAYHPYTKQLLRASEYMSGAGNVSYGSSEQEFSSEVPDRIPSGCPYHPRCSLYELKGKPSQCTENDPLLLELNSNANTAHHVSCHFAEEVNEVTR